MNTRSAREYTMFPPAELLRNWREQRPSNYGDLDEDWPASDFIVFRSSWLVGLCFKLYILHIVPHEPSFRNCSVVSICADLTLVPATLHAGGLQKVNMKENNLWLQSMLQWNNCFHLNN
jgi:hypothetical protein